MKEYVVQKGPLSSLETPAGPRAHAIRRAADYPVFQVTLQADTRHRFMAELRRSPGMEMDFMTAFVSAASEGHPVVFGLRDVENGRALLLAHRLKTLARFRWTQLKHGFADDDLVIVELPDFAGDFPKIRKDVSPTEGGMFFYVTPAPFDVCETHWRRAARLSLKSREDRFWSDAVSFAPDFRVLLHQDGEGACTLAVNPAGADADAAEKRLFQAGREAGMTLVSAPGIFG